MKIFNLKKMVAVSALGLAALVGTSEIASAQGRNNDRRDIRQDRRIDQQQERIQTQRARIQRDRLRAQQQQRQIIAAQNRQAILNRQAQLNRQARLNRQRAIVNANNNRYRVYRNGAYYNTDNRGAELLRQAVNAGYQQGFNAGRNDLNNRRGISYSNSNIYQSGTYGYQSHVSQSQYQYYFRQGFQRGYQDGSNSRYNNGYNGQYQYGSNNNGVVSILGSILGSILNLQSY